MSAFVHIPLSDGDALQGLCLHSLQEAVIQNDIANIALQLISLDLDPYAPLKFTQQQSYLRGQLEMLQTVLERSKATQKFLAEQAREQSGRAI